MAARLVSDTRSELPSLTVSDLRQVRWPAQAAIAPAEANHLPDRHTNPCQPALVAHSMAAPPLVAILPSKPGLCLVATAAGEERTMHTQLLAGHRS